MYYIGDYAEDETVYLMFNTFTSNDPSASSTITNFVNTDVHIHKDDGLTQRNNAAGITVSTDFDGITGSHMIKIDTNDNTVAGFWVTGADYFVRIEGTTVDVGTVNAVVGHFSIENRYNPVTDYDGPTKAEMDTAHGLLATEAKQDVIDGIVDNILVDTGTTLDGKIDTIDGNVDSILVDTAVIGALGAGLTGIPWNAAWDAEIQSECADALTAYDPPTKAEMDTGHGLLATEAKQDVIDGIVDNILVDTAEIGAGVALDTGAATIAGMLTKMADDNSGADFDATTDSLQAVRDRGDAAWTTGAGGSDRLLMIDTTIATLATQTSFTLTAGSADDDAYNNCTIVIEDVSTATQKAVGIISDYTGATKTVTLKYDPGIFTMAATDKVYILAENALKSTAQNRQLDVTATGATGIDWGNIENKTTANDLSATDIQLVDTTTTNTDMVGTAGANTTVPDAAGTAPTAAEIQAELEENGASLLDTIRDELANGTDGLSALKTLIDAIPTTAMRGTDNAALASVCTETRLAELAAANLPSDVDAIKAKTDNQPAGIPKNVALNNFEFLMIASADHITPKTGLTVTVQISKDGGAFAGATNSVTEIANGVYKISFIQAEQNADIITWKMTATGADQRTITIKTSS